MSPASTASRPGSHRGGRPGSARGLPVLACIALAGLGVGVSEAAPEEVSLLLSIETPREGQVVGDPGGMGFVAGRVLASLEAFEALDVILLIDQSESTAVPSGSDIDGDGIVGTRARGLSIFAPPPASSDDDDSVLAAELAAAAALLDQLDPRTTRVGIVAFAGDEEPTTPDAVVYATLGSDYDRVRAALDEIRRVGPRGRTNMAAALEQATLELEGTSPRAFSTPRPGARRVILFLTDGQPTLPISGSPAQNQRAAVLAATVAGKLGVQIDTFAIGAEALRDPSVTLEMARATQGRFTPVTDPGRLPAVFKQVSFSEVRTLEVLNRSNGATSAYLSRAADGGFSALIELDPGVNELEVYAQATDGREIRRRVSVRFLASAEVQPLSPALRSARNRLLEARLADLRERRLSIGERADEAVRRTLTDEIERAQPEDPTRRIEVDVERRPRE